jgi:HemK-related putative methylase
MPLSILPPRYGAVGAALGKAAHWGLKLFGQHRYDRLGIEWVHGLPLLVMPSVFNPRALRTGAFFAEQLDNALLHTGMDVLDMGTGSGICAIFAARHASRIVAVDINRAAVRCARINALLNHVEDRIEVRHGDLFAPVGNQRFDVILFNPPFMRGAPRDERDHAWTSIDAVQRFAAGLTTHLNPQGFALVLLSTFGDAPDFVAEFYKHRLGVAPFAEREYVNERLVILKLTNDSSNG